jgi:hypothetical protein
LLAQWVDDVDISKVFANGIMTIFSDIYNFLSEEKTSSGNFHPCHAYISLAMANIPLSCSYKITGKAEKEIVIFGVLQ